MAPHKGWIMDREAVAERRAMVMDLHKRGRYAWQIAHELRMSVRTVQRHIAASRAGRAPGKPAEPIPAVAARLPTVARLLAEGMTKERIGQAVGVSERAVFHYLRRWSDIIEQYQR